MKSNFLPDFWLTVCQEAKPGAGEDSYCRCFCENSGLVGVFDGCGGLGAQRHRDYRDCTEAYAASRICAGAFYEAFQKAPEDTDFLNWAATACDRGLNAYKPHANTSTTMRGSMVKTLPTTAAAALIRCMGPEYTVTSVWAGDSRVYLLTAEGLAQLTSDDTSVPDPMDNLYEDGILQNVLCADRKAKLNTGKVQPSGPFLIFAATDGCFGYYSTPMEFEGVLLRTMLESQSVTQWEERLCKAIGQVAGDDYTLVLAAYGFGSFQRTQNAFKERYFNLKRKYLDEIISLPLDDRDSRYRLWSQYRVTYLRYMKGEA